MFRVEENAKQIRNQHDTAATFCSRYVPPKRRLTVIGLHDVISHRCENLKSTFFYNDEKCGCFGKAEMFEAIMPFNFPAVGAVCSGLKRLIQFGNEAVPQQWWL
jgi:hypothetical protein